MAEIYKITNLINGKIYIGQTSKNSEYRFNDHFKRMNDSKIKNNYLYKALRKYKKENFKVETLISGNFNKHELSNFEKKYIKLYQSNNPKIGYNMNIGGTGGNLYIRTSEIRKKISETLKGHSNNKGIKKSEDHKLKIKNSITNLIKNGYRIPFCKYVYVYDLNMNFIKKFNSVKEAAINLNISKHHILKISRSEKSHKLYKFIITKEVLNECK